MTSERTIPGKCDMSDRENGDAPLIVDGLDCSIPTEQYACRLRAAGVSCMHLSIEDMDGRGSVHPFVRVFELLDEPGSSFRVARSVAEIRSIHAQGLIALVLGWQGADPVGVAHGTLRAYYELGLRIIGITYNTTNRYGGGCLEPARGLSHDGVALIEQVHRLGMLLDVGGHTGERSSLMAIEVSAGCPVICSHTAMSALNPNRRNTSDRVCEAIAASGGVIGILAVSDFLGRNAANADAPVTPQAPLTLMLDHLDYLKRLVGADHVGLGPDFVAGQDLSAPPAYPGNRFTPDMISEGDSIDYVHGFEAIDQLSNVVGGLRERGWTEVELGKLLGANWLRVYAAAWGPADQKPWAETRASLPRIPRGRVDG